MGLQVSKLLVTNIRQSTCWIHMHLVLSCLRSWFVLGCRDINWNVDNSLWLERGGIWTDIPEAGITTLTIKDEVMQNRIMESWENGATRWDPQPN